MQFSCYRMTSQSNISKAVAMSSAAVVQKHIKIIVIVLVNCYNAIQWVTCNK